jgi:hypothetical protein
MFGENRNVWGKQKCLGKTEMFVENRNVWGKQKCLGKTEMFGKNRNVWEKQMFGETEIFAHHLE